MASWPSLPSLAGLAKEVAAAIGPLKEIIAKMTGQSGTWRDQVVTKGDLVDGGLATYRSPDGTKHQARNASGNLIPVQEGSAYFKIPPAVTSLTATGAFASIFLEWTAPVYPYIAYYNIYRATTDDVGVATRLGTTTDTFYADNIGEGTGSAPYYYWVSVTSQANNEGPKNALAGVIGRTSYSQTYVLSVLTAKWQANHVYSANGYVIPNPVSETGLWYKTTAGGTSGGTEPTWPTVLGNTVADGTVTWTAIAVPTEFPPFMVGEIDGQPGIIINKAWIGDATITNAMIESLAADKITAGTITAAVELLAATITSGYIRTSSGTGQRLEIDDTGFFIWAGTGSKTAANGVFSVSDTGGVQFRKSDGTLILASDGTGYVATDAAAGATFTSANAGALAYANTANWQTQVSGTGKPSDNADNTKVAVEAVLSVNDAGAIRNISWPTTKKISLDFANQLLGIGTDDWASTNAKILFQYNSGTPRASIGDKSAEKYIEFDGTDVNVGLNTNISGADAVGNKQEYFSSRFSDIAGEYKQTTRASGTVTSGLDASVYQPYCKLHLAASANSYAAIEKHTFFTFNGAIQGVTSRLARVLFTLGSSWSSGIVSNSMPPFIINLGGFGYLANGVGIYLGDDKKLYGYSTKYLVSTSTCLLYDWSAGSPQIGDILMDFSSGNYVKFYNGQTRTLLGTITTNLASFTQGGDTIFSAYVQNPLSGTYSSMDVTLWNLRMAY